MIIEPRHLQKKKKKLKDKQCSLKNEGFILSIACDESSGDGEDCIPVKNALNNIGSMNYILQR